jgi:acetolactate synthase-1/3 small subunit
VEDVTHAPAVARELAFIKVRAAPERRTEVLQLCEAFRARVVDVGPASLIVESTGAQDKLDSLIEVLRPFGILELVRTGAVAMARGAPAIPFPEAASTEVGT